MKCLPPALSLKSIPRARSFEKNKTLCCNHSCTVLLQPKQLTSLSCWFFNKWKILQSSPLESRVRAHDSLSTHSSSRAGSLATIGRSSVIGRASNVKNFTHLEKLHASLLKVSQDFFTRDISEICVISLVFSNVINLLRKSKCQPSGSIRSLPKEGRSSCSPIKRRPLSLRKATRARQS